MTGQITDVHNGPRRPAAPAGRAALICAFPRATALSVPDSGVDLGRAWLVDAGLEDSKVSGAHLRFDRAGGGLRVVDLGSRNGTWVNGTALTAGDKVPLDDGAVLRLGRTVFVYRQRLVGPLEPAEAIDDLVGPYGLRRVAADIEGLRRQAPSNVLIEGETGTGKELTARALHRALRADAPYAAVNVAGVAEGVFESQMFGYVDGAFSGAKGSSRGIFAAHDGGTVFLDEIGELPPTLQAKLLRLLDNREVLPVGADRAKVVDVLVLAATNRSLDAMVEQDAFRSDLYARLSMARVGLPPLRERREDIFAIACALAKHDLARADVEVEAVECLLLAAWPRNVRQLSATLDAAARVDRQPGLRLWALEQTFDEAPPVAPRALTLETAEAAIAACGGNVTEAAKQLGISRGKLLRFRKKSR